jgi:DNA-binding response OmpR family regulator
VVDGRRIPLSRKQFQLLALVAEAGGAVCTRERIMIEVWETYAAAQEDVLDENVREIRSALHRPWIIETVHDVGFRLGRQPANGRSDR